MKKVKMILFIICIFFICSLLMQIKSYAGMTITSSGQRADKKTTSNAFAYCYNLRVSSSTLGDNSLDPHLMLNSDFATAFYLGVSTYGRGSLSGNVQSYVNNNSSGVYCIGGTEKTSAIREAYYNSSTYKSFFNNLIAFKDSNYVELLPENSNALVNKGRALGEVSGWAVTVYPPGNTHTASVGYWEPNSRTNYIGMGRCYFFNNDYDNSSAGRGDATNSGYYFRPVIWN